MDKERITPPSERVQFILGEDAAQDGTHDAHPLFSELEELCGTPPDQQWRETARFVFLKFYLDFSLTTWIKKI